jgi:hypothetical protein
MLDGFADDLELANDGVLPHTVAHEGVAAACRVLLDAVNSVANVS